METGLAPLLAVAVAGLVAALLAVWQWRRGARWQRTARRIETEAEAAWDILRTAPDGFLIWDPASGETRASGRLAVLLNLEGGTESSYADVRARFAPDDAAALDHGVEALRRDGTGFGLILPVVGPLRRVQVSGARAFRSDGTVVADILWIRDAGAATPHDVQQPATADGDLRTLVDALPFPVWLRRPDRDVAFANRAAIAVSRAEETPPLPGVIEIALPENRGTALFAPPPRPDAADGHVTGDQWARMLESLPLAIALFNADTRLAFHNGAFARLWRLDDEALAGRPRLGQVLDRLRERRSLPEVADYPAFREVQIAQFRTVTAPVESLMHLPDGRTVRRVTAPNPAGGLVFAYEDLSERLSLERSINELNAVQRETLDNLFEAVAVFGGDGRLRLHNPAFARMWDIDSDEIHIGDFAERMNARLEGHGSGARPTVSAARLMKREPAGERLARTDGSVVEYATVPLPDGAVLISFLNVTDSAQVEMALRQRAEALDEANRLKSDFIANVSYEIRTPLTTLSGFAEILTEEYFGALNRRQKEYSQGILETSQTLMTVVSDILDLASIEAGTMTLGLDTVDIHTLLAGTLKLVRERSRLKNLKVEFDCPTDIGWIVGDEKRLRQAFFNLLSNAVRFTPERGRIGLKACHENDEVVIQVTDNGPGMSEEQVGRAVQPFAHGVDTDGRGAGLGLSLVTRFIELHDGRVEIRSIPGRGTTVTCRLPTGAAADET